MRSQSIAASVLHEVLRQPAHEIAPGGLARPGAADGARRRGDVAQACSLERKDVAPGVVLADDIKEGTPGDHELVAGARRSICLACHSEIWRSASMLVSAYASCTRRRRYSRLPRVPFSWPSESLSHCRL